MSVAKTFEVEKGRTFVAGLFWHPLPARASTAVRNAEIRKLAKEQTFDLMVVRTMGSPQVGFGVSDSGMVAGMYSAAAIISKGIEIEGLSRNTLCALQITDRKWYYFAQRDGITLPNGDQIGEEDEMRSKILEQISVTDDWETIIAPEHWNIPQSTERSFVSFIPKKGKKGDKYDYKSWWTLRPVHRKLVNVKLMGWTALLSAIAVSGAYGYVHYRAYVENKQMSEITAQTAAQSLLAPKAQPKPEHPWKQQPAAVAFANACGAALESVPSLFPANWDPTSIVCAGGTTTVTWKRPESGTLTELLQEEKRAAISADGNTATLVIPTPHQASADDHLDTVLSRVNAMNSTAQSLSLALSFVEQKQKAMLPGDKPTTSDQIVEWGSKDWTVSATLLDPATVALALDGKGFRINSISTTFDGGVMKRTIQGTQYVQP